MQPLYYFNVKKTKEDIAEEEERQIKKSVKEANTPCFIGSPVNKDDKGNF